MQSGTGKSIKWILEFETNNPTKNPLMGWESSNDTLSGVIIEFSSKELAVNPYFFFNRDVMDTFFEYCFQI